MTTDEKSMMRETCLERRRSLEPEERADADDAINDALASLPEVTSAPLVAAYVSDGSEPCLIPCARRIIAAGGRCCFPRSDRSAEAGYVMVEVTRVPDDFVPGPYGILEPPASAPASTVDDLRAACWLVPGVAFDASGARLGRGKAVYDRLLRGLTGPRIGVFYSCQRAEGIPVEDHDQPLTLVVTEKGVTRIEKRG